MEGVLPGFEDRAFGYAKPEEDGKLCGGVGGTLNAELMAEFEATTGEPLSDPLAELGPV